MTCANNCRGVNPNSVIVGGTAALDGTLNVQLFGRLEPLEVLSFDVVVASTILGTFSDISLPDIETLLWDVEYLLDSDGLDRVRLTVTNTVPVPAAVWLFGSALCLLGWLRKRAT